MPSHHAEQVVRELRASLGLRRRPGDIAQLIQDSFAARRVDPGPATAEALEEFAAPVGVQRPLARATAQRPRY